MGVLLSMEKCTHGARPERAQRRTVRARQAWYGTRNCFGDRDRAGHHGRFGKIVAARTVNLKIGTSDDRIMEDRRLARKQAVKRNRWPDVAMIRITRFFKASQLSRSPVPDTASAPRDQSQTPRANARPAPAETRSSAVWQSFCVPAVRRQWPDPATV